MTLVNRQLRALKLAQNDGKVSEQQWTTYGYSKAYVDDLAASGYLQRWRGSYSLTAKGERALEESR